MNTALSHGRSRTTEATKARKLRGQSTDEAIQRIVTANPGLSIYEIQKLTDSSVGLIDGSLKRLERKGFVKIHRVLRGGRLINRVVPSNYQENNSGELKLEREVFENADVWQKWAFLYALNRSSIGISPSKEEEWESEALFKATVEIRKNDKNIFVQIPPKFRDFYLWQNSKPDISIIGELVLITLTTELPAVEPKKSNKASRSPSSP